jgi:hypothetical protein
MQLCAVEEGSTEHDDSPDADKQALESLELYSTPTNRQREGEKPYQSGKMKHNFEQA